MTEDGRTKSTLYEWAEKEVPLEAKKLTKPRGKKIPNPESFGGERSLEQEHQHEQPGRHNISPEEYDLHYIDEYDDDL